jgi:hypothetical protein
MYVRLSSVFVLSCVDSSLCNKADHPSKEPYRLCKIPSSKLILMGNRPVGLVGTVEEEEKVIKLTG